MELFLTIPPTLIFFVFISGKDLISDGDWKKTTFSSRDFNIKKTDKLKVIRINKIKKNLNLTL
tara:strand:+ start:931 stop:1119 length:189 start_codon:yes stop_codon:yes gene_type:complete